MMDSSYSFPLALPPYQTCMSLAPETNHLRLTVLQTSFHPKKAHAAKGHAFKHKTFQTWRNGFTIGKHFKRLLPTTSIPSHRRTVRRATPTWRSETLESLLSVVASIHRYSHGGWHPRAVFIRSNTSFRHAGRFPWVGLVEWLVFGGLLKILKKISQYDGASNISPIGGWKIMAGNFWKFQWRIN